MSWIHWYVKANNKYIKNCDKNKGSLYLKYWYVNNLDECSMSQNLPVGGFNWVENKSKDFIKNYNEYSDIRYFLEVNV